jgi:hypothetical protein
VNTKRLQKERQTLRDRLKLALFSEHRHPGKSSLRRNKIEELTRQDESLTQRMEQTHKTVSRLEYLLDENYRDSTHPARSLWMR